VDLDARARELLAAGESDAAAGGVHDGPVEERSFHGWASLGLRGRLEL
jgi:hypothetical protein